MHGDCEKALEPKAFCVAVIRPTWHGLEKVERDLQREANRQLGVLSVERNVNPKQTREKLIETFEFAML